MDLNLYNFVSYISDAEIAAVAQFSLELPVRVCLHALGRNWAAHRLRQLQWLRETDLAARQLLSAPLYSAVSADCRKMSVCLYVAHRYSVETAKHSQVATSV